MYLKKTTKERNADIFSIYMKQAAAKKLSIRKAFHEQKLIVRFHCKIYPITPLKEHCKHKNNYKD